jgi:hypothetical protein
MFAQSLAIPHVMMDLARFHGPRARTSRTSTLSANDQEEAPRAGNVRGAQLANIELDHLAPATLLRLRPFRRDLCKHRLGALLLFPGQFSRGHGIRDDLLVLDTEGPGLQHPTEQSRRASSVVYWPWGECLCRIRDHLAGGLDGLAVPYLASSLASSSIFLASPICTMTSSVGH